MLKVTIIILALFSISNAITYFCSAYCNVTNCTGVASNNCGGCPPLFVFTSPNCNYPATYTVLYQQANLSNTNYTCGPYSVVSMTTPLATNTTIFTGLVPGHYKYRIRVFIIWINGTFASTDTIFIYTESAVATSIPFSNVTQLNLTACTGTQKQWTLDTYDQTHTNSTLTVNILCNSSAAGLIWGYKQFLIFIKPCDPKCLNCSVTATNCTACTNYSGTNYCLKSYTCYATCPNGYVNNNDTNLCMACATGCATCVNTTINCTSCNTNYYYYSINNTCPTSCPSGYFSNSTGNICLVCNPACLNCTGDTITQCTACTNYSSINFVLFVSTCLDSCPVGYFNNSANTCAICGANCATCSVTYVNCTSCASTGYLNGTICSACNSNCLTCVGNSTNCTSCTGAQVILANGSCAASCPNTYYLNSGTNICLSCDPSCSVCTANPYPCSVCATGYIIYATNSSCCPTYYYIDSSSGQCFSCSSYCTTCTNNTTCTACLINYYLYNSICYSSCPFSTYANSSNTCNLCNTNCTTCNITSTNCSACANTYVLVVYNYTCLSTCPNGTYASGNNCIQCNSNCSACQNTSTNCSVCAPSFLYLNNNTCLSNCPSNYYKNSTNCIICPTNCLTCISNISCLTCISGYNFLNSSCYYTCPSGYYNSLSNCLLCHNNCTNCNGTSTNCSTCAVNYYLISFNNTCLNTCPNQYYANTTTSICYICSSICSTCSGNPYPCSACINGYYLFNNTCLTSCPINYFPDSSINNCSSCNSYCSVCVKNSNNCTSCLQNYYYIPSNNTCSTSCQGGLVYNSISSICINCSSNGYASYCVSLTINVYTSDTSNSMSPIYADLNFSQNINFTTFPYQTFQTISFSNPSINTSMFNITYNITSNSSYRIILMPNGTGIQYNVQIYVKTVNFTQSYYSTTNNIFSNSVYGMYNFTNWTYQYCNCTSSTQNQIMTSMSQLSSSMNNIQSGISFLYELKKFGFIFLIMNSLQITTCLILINTLLPNNLYTTLQIMSIFIFPQNHPQQTKGDPTVIFGQNIIYYTGSYRLLPFANNRLLSLQEFTFNRSGFTSYFIFDAYAPIISIIICYVLLAICKCNFLTRVRPIVQTLLYRLHQIAILYFTLTIIFQFQYITVVNTYRYLSILTCLVVTIYFTLYHAYIFYDFMPYPKVEIQTQQFDYYVMKYGNLLRNIRYEDYPDNQGYALLKNWIRPYNYHTISFIKKFAMMIALVVFYDQGLNQILALMFIQVAEIFRFYYTWPFYSKARNIIRLFLEFVLLGIFSLILSSDLIYKQMMANPQTISQLGSTYYSVGWIAISLIILFTVMHLCVFIFDLVYCVKSSNKERMHQIRLDFYNKKFKNYERLESKDYVRINDMIKRGIVEPIKFSDLPSIEVRIQQYEIIPRSQSFEIDINKVTQICMASHAFINKYNANIKVSKKIMYRGMLNNRSQQFKKILELTELIQQEDFYSVIYKTYMIIDQCKYKNDEKIIFYKEKMRNEIYVVRKQSEPPIIKYKGQLINLLPFKQEFIERIIGRPQL